MHSGGFFEWEICRSPSSECCSPLSFLLASCQWSDSLHQISECVWFWSLLKYPSCYLVAFLRFEVPSFSSLLSPQKPLRKLGYLPKHTSSEGVSNTNGFLEERASFASLTWQSWEAESFGQVGNPWLGEHTMNPFLHVWDLQLVLLRLLAPSLQCPNGSASTIPATTPWKCCTLPTFLSAPTFDPIPARTLSIYWTRWNWEKQKEECSYVALP